MCVVDTVWVDKLMEWLTNPNDETTGTIGMKRDCKATKKEGCHMEGWNEC